MNASGFANAALEIQGHRGARWVLPENTLPAFEYALGLGVDVLEMDLGVTRDHEVVIYHDQTLNPKICLAPGGKKIEKEIPLSSLSLDELKKYDCGTLRHPDFEEQKSVPGTRIPTLREFVEWLTHSKHPNASKVRLNLELKSDPRKPQWAPPPPEFVRAVLDVLERSSLLPRVGFQSFDLRILIEAHRVAPQVPRAALLNSRPSDLVSALKAVHADILSPNKDWINADDVEGVHRAGMRVIPWTANQPDDWKRLIQMKVDGIITDHPKALMDFVRKDLQ